MISTDISEALDAGRLPGPLPYDVVMDRWCPDFDPLTRWQRWLNKVNALSESIRLCLHIPEKYWALPFKIKRKRVFYLLPDQKTLICGPATYALLKSVQEIKHV